MAKIDRRNDLVINSLAYQMFGKRYADLAKEELNKYNAIRKQASREKQDYKTMRQKENMYMANWLRRKKENARGTNSI